MNELLLPDDSEIHFHGTFRPYQKTVLDHAQQYLSDGKINIVAAPGSGKTTLALELIRRLHAPALIFAPSIVIRRQWRDCFSTGYLPPQCAPEKYISMDLKHPAWLTCVTYQSLYAAWNHRKEEIEDGSAEDYTSFDLLSQIQQAGIHTICLDEAHHLRGEWQKALEEFIARVSAQMTVISLTATPPYDSTLQEWERYTSLCGDIDEEIFTPQLVAQKNLCPHQDYIAFSRPSSDECRLLEQWRSHVSCAAEQLTMDHEWENALDSIGARKEPLTEETEEIILDQAGSFSALFVCARNYGVIIPESTIRLVSPAGRLPVFSLPVLEQAFQLLTDEDSPFDPACRERIRHILSHAGILMRGIVNCSGSPQVLRAMSASCGKIRSILAITSFEYARLKNDLRLVILTDYIRADLQKTIGTGEPITQMGAVPIYEFLRRGLDPAVSMAVLSGSVTIVPEKALAFLQQECAASGLSFHAEPILDIHAYTVTFSGSNKDKVAVMTRAFEKGLFPVLIGTAALLGEGWDSPCINTLILASSVGSFVLSNQMRGRAMRADPLHPEKTANIWHLLTAEPPLNPTDVSVLEGKDYEILARRFRGFLGPVYDGVGIETGIERLKLQPPFDDAGLQRLNQKMLQRAADRSVMAQQWQQSLHGSLNPEIIEDSAIHSAVIPEHFVYCNQPAVTVMPWLSGAAFAAAGASWLSLPANYAPGFGLVLAGIGLFSGSLALPAYLRSRKWRTSAAAVRTFGQCILAVLQEMKLVDSPNASVAVSHSPNGQTVWCSLQNAVRREKQIFASCIRDFLSAIDNPRYVLIGRQGKHINYAQSYACPALIAARREDAQLLQQQLNRAGAVFDLVYTRNADGRKKLLQCRRQSCLNLQQAEVSMTRRVRKDWE